MGGVSCQSSPSPPRIVDPLECFFLLFLPSMSPWKEENKLGQEKVRSEIRYEINLRFVMSSIRGLLRWVLGMVVLDANPSYWISFRLIFSCIPSFDRSERKQIVAGKASIRGLLRQVLRDGSLFYMPMWSMALAKSLCLDMGWSMVAFEHFSSCALFSSLDAIASHKKCFYKNILKLGCHLFIAPIELFWKEKTWMIMKRNYAMEGDELK